MSVKMLIQCGQTLLQRSLGVLVSRRPCLKHQIQEPRSGSSNNTVQGYNFHSSILFSCRILCGMFTKSLLISRISGESLCGPLSCDGSGVPPGTQLR